jgi:DNA polymerase elongation subunit (family B)
MIKFQILDWSHLNKENSSGEKEFVIRLFGRTEDEKTIYCETTNFRPYFFIKMDSTWRKTDASTIINELKERIKKRDESLLDGFLGYNIIEKHDFYGFTDFKRFNFIRLEFTNYETFTAFMYSIKKKVKIGRTYYKLKAYESNIIPYIRMMHMLNLRSVGWVEAHKYTVLEKEESTYCDVNIRLNWMDLKPNEDIKNQKFTILSYDIECKSIDGSFPNPERDGDKIIQIGITISRYGESECYYKHIITLGSCSPIDGIIVESYETEEEVLLAFSRLIRELNPDFITGYNIFGFDYNYLNERAKKLGILNKFARLSRIKNEISEFVLKDLSSSALGENKLKYFDMTGRINFDLMKIMQRDFKLPSYKLDEVASFFIREVVIDIKPNLDINNTRIITKNTNGLKLNQYIKIGYNDGMTENKHMDGKKFKVIELGKDYILVNGIIETEEILNRGYKIFWCQAKDDIGPNEIFKLQDGSADDRAIIAKYCIQDCALCNLLISKLQILTNNIGMAIVCNVPLSFLFLRGQGVKIFSLVSKKCREREHLIPVLKHKPKKETEVDTLIAKQTEVVEKYIKNKYSYYEDDEDDDDDNLGYEGATVIDPIKGVHYEPIPVLDFSSLYPNAMRLRNLSQEMYVNNEKYDNLDGYIYHTITYRNSDNTYTTCKFAEKKDGTKGIIPEILTELLNARKKYKKQMEQLKENKGDPFMIAILDGLQLAYKVTANSLYGQTGAPTSPIYMKQIAASTTATGREMLQFSKYFIENIFGNLAKLALTDKDKYYEEIRKVYTYFPDEIEIDETNKVHISSEIKKLIPDSKFIRKEIEFHIKTYEQMKKEYEKELIELDIKSEEEFEIKIKEYLSNYKKSYKRLRKYSDNFRSDIFDIVDNIGFANREEMFERFYNMINRILENKTISPNGIYGDTDSIFYCPHIKDKETGEVIKDKSSVVISIKLGIWSSILISTLLPSPMAQEYEKVMYPFIILTKKRYVGNLYEKDPNKFYQKSMGIVLKRRDNAPIVKIVCGNIIDQILNKRSSEGAINITRQLLHKIITGKMPLDKFIITKTLKFSYKDRTRIVHAVLADRMAERDPGNKPESNDRIPYVYFEIDYEPELQGDRVEHPEYLVKNGLKLDYLFYITNQIMKPCIQFLELIVENPELIFNEYIIKETNRKMGKMPIRYHLMHDENGELHQDNTTFDNFSENIEKDMKEIKEIKPNKYIKPIKKTKINKLKETKDIPKISFNLEDLIDF